MKIVQRIAQDYFASSLDLSVQTFNLLGSAGFAAGLFVAVSCAVTGAGIENAAINLAASVLALVLLRYTRRTGRYRFSVWLTVISVFMVAFPVLFFTAGGYRSGMPSFYIFALVFTSLLLDGRSRMAALAVELTLYLSSCVIAYRYPQSVIPFETEWSYVLDIMVGILVSGTLLFLFVLLYVRAHNMRRDALDEMNRTLALRNETLKQYDEMKSTFLATVAHEIRTPLSIISGTASDTLDLLGENPINMPEIVHNQREIEKVVLRIDGILMDLMDTVAMERGSLSLDRTMGTLASLLQEVYDENTEFVRKTGNRLVLRMDSGMPEIAFDGPRMKQVLLNLLSNACRHTRNGEIAIRLRGDAQRQIVSVTDNGEGMTAECPENAMDGAPSAHKDHWRHGIGLNVCRQIVSAHGGTLWIESSQGQGTAVYFALSARDKEGVQRTD